MDHYILSKSHSPAGSNLLWWRPSNCGYTTDLTHAGRYTAEAVAASPGYYDNGSETVAIPCETVDAVARTVRIVPDIEITGLLTATPTPETRDE